MTSYLEFPDRPFLFVRPPPRPSLRGVHYWLLFVARAVAGAAERDGRGVPTAQRQPVSLQGAHARPCQNMPQRDDEGRPHRLLLMTCICAREMEETSTGGEAGWGRRQIWGIGSAFRLLQMRFG